MRSMKTIIRGAFGLILCTVTLSAQDFQIRTRVDLVVVSCAVKDAKDGFVTHLGKDDFTVLEDDVVQSIQQFSIDPMPLAAVLLVDTGLPVKSLKSIQESVPALVAAFSELDEVAIYRFDNTVRLVQDFVADPELLRQALDQLRNLPPTVETVGGETAQPSPTVNGRSIVTTARTPFSRDKRVLHDAIYDASLALRNRTEEKRRIILVISDGNTKASKFTFDENLIQLVDNEIQVYTVGVKVNWFSRINSVLNNYAVWTGGSYSSTSSAEDLGRVYSKLTEQARNQYVIGYVSNNQAPPTKIVFRRVEIRSSKPYKISHKKGYYQIP